MAKANCESFNDKQNMLLTQISYSTELFVKYPEGKTLRDIKKDLDKRLPKDDDTRVLLDQLDDELLGLKIKAVEHDKISGFGAVAFTDDYGNTAISYRGSDDMTNPKNLNDWLDNIMAAAKGSSLQTTQANAFFNKYKDKDGNNFLYGHSKGGCLSESVFSKHHKQIKKAHLLNPQPLNLYTLTPSQRKAMRSDKLDIVVGEGDAVWLSGFLSTFGNIRFVKTNGKNFIDNHMFSALLFNGNDLIPGEPPAWQSFLMNSEFVVSLTLLPFELFYSAVDTLIRLYQLQAELVYTFIDALIEQLVQFSKELISFAVELKEFLSLTVQRIQKWWNSNFNNGYQAAIAHPQIVVDTYKLRNYADRLQRVNKRIVALDHRLDSLYWQIGLVGLWNLMHADLLTNYSRRITKCSGYLNDTANEFEQVENSLCKGI